VIPSSAMRTTLALLVLLFTSCATIDTLGMSPTCRDLYNACLSACPQAPAPQPGQLQTWHIDTAQCTDRCNSDAKRCNAPQVH
jgi:hypothetical protein